MKNTWQQPHISKVYEALTAIADNRIEFIDGSHVKCFSTSGNKYYEIHYDKPANAIMSNDNSSYYTGTLSYPMIAMLMLLKEITYDKSLLKPLAGIFWKEINTRFKNDYDKAIEYVLSKLREKGENVEFIKSEAEKIYIDVCKLRLNFLGKKVRPPVGF